MTGPSAGRWVRFAEARLIPPLLAVAALPALRTPPVALGVVLLVAWTVAELLAEDPAANRAAVGSAQDRGTRLVVLGAHLLAWWAPLAEVALRGGTRPGLAFPAGVALFATGAGLRLAAVRTLGASFTAHVRVRADQRVCGGGPYGYVRHPSYVGLFLINLSLSVSAGVHVSLALVAASTLAANALRARVEEATLLAVLGDEYDRYRRSVPAWIPAPWARLRSTTLSARPGPPG